MRSEEKSMRGWVIRLSIFLGMMMLVVFGLSQKSPSALATDSETASLPFDPSEVFNNYCLTPEPEQSGGQSSGVQAPVSGKVLGGDIPHVRAVMDQYPSFTGVAVDPENNLALMIDANKKSVLIYDRTSGSKSGEQTRPLRQIIGPDAMGGYFAGVFADGERREVYAVNNDIEDAMVVYSYDANGNTKPKRALGVPHGSWGVSMSRARDEIALTVQDLSTNALIVFRREAKNAEAPLRTVQGLKTELADPHGIYFDDVNKELVVTNWGSWNVPLKRFDPPQAYPPRSLPGGVNHAASITVYPETAQGDVAPLRKIQGPATHLNWPFNIDVDTVSNEIAVANNGDDSVLIFPRNGSGNIKPLRVIKGSRTGLSRPTGVSIDRKNKELWVANFADHTAVVFDLSAKGNAAPKRVIRNAPAGTPTSGFGNPMSVTYDSKRDELLVPN
jgi:DNA-binding beta-propeller fold protein YncE